MKNKTKSPQALKELEWLKDSLCIYSGVVVFLLWWGNQTFMEFGFCVKFDFAYQGQSPPKTIGILTNVFCTSGPNLAILAWTWWVIMWTNSWLTHMHCTVRCRQWQYIQRPKLTSGRNWCPDLMPNVTCNQTFSWDIATHIFDFATVRWHRKVFQVYPRRVPLIYSYPWKRILIMKALVLLPESKSLREFTAKFKVIAIWIFDLENSRSRSKSIARFEAQCSIDVCISFCGNRIIFLKIQAIRYFTL